MDAKNLIGAALAHPVHAIAYEADRLIAEIFPEHGIISVSGCSFDVERYAAAGFCSLRSAGAAHDRRVSHWEKSHGVWDLIESGMFDAEWNERDFVVISITWPNDRYGSTAHAWIVGDDKASCEAFYAAVCAWSNTTNDEVLVFMEGDWTRSTELYNAIKASSFDNLILPAELAGELRDDIDHFLASQAAYERYGIPWKRGILLMGPPGNGKTHAVKALINRTNVPCLYVKSFKSPYGSDHGTIHSVFERARKTTPCLLVLEDLDSLLNDKNRSFFLNELDGFETNTGVIVLATTNHADRLDPAIIDRPSRFDRKYHFELPALAERARYLSAWNDRVEPDLRLDPGSMSAVVDATEGFSFAYLKELCLSAMMRWIANPRSGTMGAVMLTQTGTLRSQMTSDPGRSERDLLVTEENEDADEDE